MPLSIVNTGAKVALKGMNCGFKLKKRLEEMGITQGVNFSVISNDTHGSLIIDVRGSRIALGRGIAQKIMVDIQ